MSKFKKANGTIIWVLVLLAVLYLTSVNQVEFNDKQIKTATEPSCKLIGKLYNPVYKICVDEITAQVLNNATNATV